MNTRFDFATCVLLAVFLAGCQGEQSLPQGSRNRPFKSTQWLEPHSSDYRAGGVSVREEMLADLVEHVLPGKTRGEIETLLGKSLDTPYFRNVPKDLIYYLGPERSSFANIDSEWLLISLDAHGTFRSYVLKND